MTPTEIRKIVAQNEDLKAEVENLKLDLRVAREGLLEIQETLAKELAAKKAPSVAV